MFNNIVQGLKVMFTPRIQEKSQQPSDSISWVTIRLSLVMILNFTSLKCLLLQNGEFPLHIACRYYDPSKQKRINTCVILIVAGANYQKRNRVSLTLSRIITCYNSY